MDAAAATDAGVAARRAIDERALSKLRWRCRRGLLENDLLIERCSRAAPRSARPMRAASTH